MQEGLCFLTCKIQLWVSDDIVFEHQKISLRKESKDHRLLLIPSLGLLHLLGWVEASSVYPKVLT